MTVIVRGRYFPATVQLPDEPKPRRRQYVVLAEGEERSGLHVFSRPALVADVHLPVDFAATVIPTGRGARNGVHVVLADGRRATITPNAGCKCGSLGRWNGPSWAHTVQAVAR